MPLTATVAVALASGLDWAVAEPPTPVHPVALFGRLVAPLDREWTAARIVGVTIAVVFPLLAACVAGGIVYGASVVGGVVYAASAAGGVATGTGTVDAAGPNAGTWLAALTASLVLFSTTSLRMLCSTAREVVAASDCDIDVGRRELLALAGRDASALSAAQIRSAAVESAAENLADGLVAPLGGFVVGVVLGNVFGSPGVDVGGGADAATFALAFGAGGAAWVKAVNTLDSMLGYRSKPVGWAPARLDDLVMWVPARVSALLLAVAASDPGALGRARDDARIPASPNSGWPMATLAAVLGSRLEKPGHYVLGDEAASLPDAAVAAEGIDIVSRAGWLAVALAGVIVWP